jgi:hypothetical protein
MGAIGLGCSITRFLPIKTSIEAQERALLDVGRIWRGVFYDTLHDDSGPIAALRIDGGDSPTLTRAPERSPQSGSVARFSRRYLSFIADDLGTIFMPGPHSLLMADEIDLRGELEWISSQETLCNELDAFIAEVSDDLDPEELEAYRTVRRIASEAMARSEPLVFHWS